MRNFINDLLRLILWINLISTSLVSVLMTYMSIGSTSELGRIKFSIELGVMLIMMVLTAGFLLIENHLRKE